MNCSYRLTFWALAFLPFDVTLAFWVTSYFWQFTAYYSAPNYSGYGITSNFGAITISSREVKGLSHAGGGQWKILSGASEKYQFGNLPEHFLGFYSTQVGGTQDYTSGKLSWSDRYYTYSEWSVATVTAPFPAIPLLMAWKKRRAARWQTIGRCLNCGYDLRATPDRCPECGTIPPETRYNPRR
jgi:hypothetical protein